ncbi:ARM repeat-containing protein [Suhomyces tanzawaensis NRRL Y-17324]|uniref:ARM repeat-containing protein n=1 Tax=Suhomyces tanzawaensis NRRL Y-17324 TaxID=984487 RepID=A0A1E4SC59_9ASCO|nr:ARM repeat-containing protein [Suhomyces tanzawaensis NRRL Y-17324]ODV77097.1 ARM repeat-containing protein [Suhomyces tanzawaensis NRRL Y-17324]
MSVPASRRAQLYDLNIRAWSGELVFRVSAKPDSSLKKNTAFIKKVRTSIHHEQKASILQDIQLVSLEKYLSEIIVAVSEGLRKVTKNDDIWAAVEVISALHQRFSSQFTPYLLVNMLTALSTKQSGVLVSEEVYRSRAKSLFNLLVEFFCVGVFRTLKDCDKEIIPEPILAKFGKSASQPILVLVLKDLLNYEFTEGGSLPVAVSFVKRFSFLLENEQQPELNIQEVLSVIFRRYTEVVLERAKVLADQVHKLEVRNHKASIRTGKFLEEIVTELEETSELFENFKAAGITLGEALDMPVPEFSQATETLENSDAVVEVVKSKSGNEDDMEGVWEDIKQKNFYTKIPKLSELEKTLPEQFEEIKTSLLDGEKISLFLNEMDEVDDSTLEPLVVLFNELNINNKATRNRILRFFMDSPNMSTLRYYAKFLKINEENFSELIEELVDNLDKGFRSQIYHNSISFRYIYFFVEMIKFKLIPTHVIFHKIRVLTIRIGDPGAIDLLSILYERVGRFLLNEPEYKELMQEMVEILKQKQRSAHGINEKLAINNLLIIIDPPIIKVNQEKKVVLTPIQQFVYRLVRVELKHSTFKIIFSIFKELQLDSEEIIGPVLDCFTHPESINYDDLPFLAKLIPSSNKYKSLRIRIIDTLIEQVKRGLELNDYRSNRTRMTQIKYFGELYNQELLSFKTIIDLMYKIICSGHPNNQLLPGYEVTSDPPDNFFRVQMCCSLLLSMKGDLFAESGIKSKPARSKKFSLAKTIERKKELLKVFLVFFQYYVFCKNGPVPMEIEFQLNDVFVKYSLVSERYNSFKETVARLQEIVQEKGLQNDLNREDEYDDEDDVDDFDDEVDFYDEEDDDNEDDEEEEDLVEEEEDDEKEEDDDEEEEDDEEEDSTTDEESTSEGESEDYDAETPPRRVITEKEKLKIAEDKQFEEDMERQFQQMVSESYELSKGSSALGKRLNMPSVSQYARTEEVPVQGSKMSFSLLTKAGKKTSAKQVNIPTDTNFAATILKERANQKQDKARIMDLVYEMD